MTTTTELWAGGWSGEVHAADEFVSVVFYAFDEGWRKGLIGRNVIVAQYDPQTGAIALLLSADGAGELHDFHGVGRLRRQFEIGEIFRFFGDGFVVRA